MFEKELKNSIKQIYKVIFDKKILLVYLFSIFLYFPALWIYFDSNISDIRLDLMMQQAENPFNVDYSTPNNIANNVLAYRIVVPLINHFFGLRGFWIILPSLLGAYLLLIVSSKILERYHSRLNSIIVLVSLSTSYLFVSGTNFWQGYDSLAISTVLLIVLVRPIWLQSILIILALSIDERTIVSILILPILIKAYEEQKIISLKEVFLYYLKWIPSLISVFLLRLLITNGVLFSAPGYNPTYDHNYGNLLQYWSYHPKRIGFVLIQWFLSIRWLWFYIALFFINLFNDYKNTFFTKGKFNFFKSQNLESKYLSILYFLTLILTYFISNLFVGDIWRCALYIFPILYTSILMIKEDKKIMYKINLSILILMIITPQFFLGNFLSDTTTAAINIVYPLPLVLIRTFFLNF